MKMFYKMLGALLALISVRAWNPDQLECIQELNLNQAELNQFDRFRIAPEDNEDLIKLAECHWTKKKFFDDDGNVDPKAIENVSKQMLETSNHPVTDHERSLINLVNEAIEECSERTFDGSKGRVALKVQNCIYKFLMKNVGESGL